MNPMLLFWFYVRRKRLQGKGDDRECLLGLAALLIILLLPALAASVWGVSGFLVVLLLEFLIPWALTKVLAEWRYARLRAQQEARGRQARETEEACRRNRHSALSLWTGGRIGK